MSRTALALLLVGCGAAAPTPRATSHVRPYYVATSAPACVDDEGELGALVATLRFEDGDAPEGPLTPGRAVLVRAAHDCTIATRQRAMRLTTSEAFAEACRPEGEEHCEFARSCWAIGGPPEHACDAETALGHLAEMLALLSSPDAGTHLTALGGRDPAARADVETVYVETGNAFWGQGHLVQRVDGAWRVVLSELVWQF